MKHTHANLLATSNTLCNMGEQTQDLELRSAICKVMVELAPMINQTLKQEADDAVQHLTKVVPDIFAIQSARDEQYSTKINTPHFTVWYNEYFPMSGCFVHNDFQDHIKGNLFLKYDNVLHKTYLSGFDGVKSMPAEVLHALQDNGIRIAQIYKDKSYDLTD